MADAPPTPTEWSKWLTEVLKDEFDRDHAVVATFAHGEFRVTVTFDFEGYPFRIEESIPAPPSIHSGIEDFVSRVEQDLERRHIDPSWHAFELADKFTDAIVELNEAIAERHGREPSARASVFPRDESTVWFDLRIEGPGKGEGHVFSDVHDLQSFNALRFRFPSIAKEADNPIALRTLLRSSYTAAASETVDPDPEQVRETITKLVSGPRPEQRVHEVQVLVVEDPVNHDLHYSIDWVTYRDGYKHQVGTVVPIGVDFGKVALRLSDVYSTVNIDALHRAIETVAQSNGHTVHFTPPAKSSYLTEVTFTSEQLGQRSYRVTEAQLGTSFSPIHEAFELDDRFRRDATSERFAQHLTTRFNERFSFSATMEHDPAADRERPYLLRVDIGRVGFSYEYETRLEDVRIDHRAETTRLDGQLHLSTHPAYRDSLSQDQVQTQSPGLTRGV